MNDTHMPGRSTAEILEQVFASISVMLAYMDRDFNFIKVNRAYAEADGRDPGFFPGRNHFALYPDAGNEAIFRRVIATAEPYRASERPFVHARHPERGTTWWDWLLQPVTDSTGRVDGLVLSIVDVTDKVLAKQRAERAAVYARGLIEASLDPLVTIGPDGKITDVNAATEQATGRSREGLIGTDFSDYFTSPEQARHGYQEVFRTGFVRDFPLEIRHLDGHSTPVLYNASIYRDEHGAVAGVFAAARDMTERQRGERALQEMNRELERRVEERTASLQEANRELESFSYSVSHDLRTPLRAVDGFSRILLTEYQDRLDDEGKRLLGIVRENTARMGQLITDILNFSRTGRAELRAEPVDMEVLARDAWEQVRQGGPPRPMEFRLASPLPPALGDRNLLRQIWVNLLSNAAKFTRPCPQALIEIGAQAGEAENTYWVKDNGVGFDMAYAERLFGVFQRLHGAEFEGTGIGLAIIKRIVVRHGGRVWAEGAPGAGATFYFALPKMEAT